MTDHPNVSRTWATFRVWGKHLNPDEVTYLMGMSPSASHKAGDKRGKSGIHKHGYWGITSQDRVSSRDLEIHLEWLVAQLESVQAQVVELNRNADTQADIFCFRETESVNAGIVFSPALMGRLAMLNLKLGLDIYFAF